MFLIAFCRCPPRKRGEATKKPPEFSTALAAQNPTPAMRRTQSHKQQEQGRGAHLRPRQCSKCQNYALPAARGHGLRSPRRRTKQRNEKKAAFFFRERERRVHQSRPRASDPVLQSRPWSRGNAALREMVVETRRGNGRRAERRTLRAGDRRRRGEEKPYAPVGVFLAALRPRGQRRGGDCESSVLLLCFMVP